ncbi:tyrosine-type recombinase/integrase [Micromonospora sp. NPDC051300]|uniref:tyrosine-type recombinase/integrase n=1 Tax=Micromonospora sp. NPDC051300 TaxID=3364286 RepID=UPI0037BD8117
MAPVAGWTEHDLIEDSVADLPLPASELEDRWQPVTVAWLLSRRSPHTRRAYFADLAHFLAWLAETGLEPLRVRRPDLDRYLAVLRASSPRPSPATINRRLASLSSWYGYLLDADVAIRNPVVAVDREPVDRDFSPTVGLTVAEVRALLRAADDVVSIRRRRRMTAFNAWLVTAAERDRLLVGLLAHLGLRVGEALALRCEDLRHDAGHRTVLIRGKGGRRRQLPVPAPLLRLLDPFVTERRRAADRAESERHFDAKHHELTLALQQRGYRADEARNRSQHEIDAARRKDLALIAAASPEDLAKVPVPGPLLCTGGGNPLTQAAVFATVRRLGPVLSIMEAR